MGEDEGGVYISSGQMYSELRRLGEAVARIDAKLDSLREQGAGAAATLSDHEERLRALEGARWPLPTVGALTGVAGAVTGVLALLR